MYFKNFSIIPNLSDSVFSKKFNKINKFFNKITNNIPSNSFPLYNIKRKNNYLKLIISLPGWKKNELEINLINNQLNIIGNKIKKENKKYYIYKGIVKNNFNINYSIPQNSKITSANLKNGILSINIEQKIPENKKPKKIQINKK